MDVYEGGKSNVSPPQMPKGLIRNIVIGLVVVAVLSVGFTMFYTVEEQEEAAILTFGQYTRTENTAGLKMKLPYPIQQVVKVPAKLTQEIQIGFREVDGEIVPVEDEALMITGDENLVSADAVVEWRVSNIRNYLYNIDDPEAFLRNSATAAIRSVIGSNRLDFAITEGKTVIQAEVKDRLIEMQDLYQTGIHIVDLKFQDIEPPEGEVQQAFKEVTNAREEKNTKINNAQQYVNQRLPLARGEARALIENAQAEKQRRILNAQGDVAKFNALYEAYANNPAVTESRLIVETLEKILPNAKIIITNDQGNTVNYLPLNELLRGTSGTGSGAAGSNRNSGSGSTGPENRQTQPGSSSGNAGTSGGNASADTPSDSSPNRSGQQGGSNQ